MVHLPTILLSKELSAQLKLQEQHFVLLIPKKLISLNELSFELIIKNNKISLVSSNTNSIPKVSQPEMIDT
ncbi:MAG: hypothetical protein HOD60_12945 [Candidatus Nitrosopelagicus sp.]|jgi:hypothetical protein|nr:hypothetical protein [Candidatus Nitrosopelagicus sp.]